MKKKFFKGLCTFLFLGMVCLNAGTIFAQDENNKLVKNPQTDGEVICYCTYTYGGTWSIIRCEDCKRVNLILYFGDRSTCEVEPE